MGKRIAVIGSGGTALAAAATFTRTGHTVTLTDDARHQETLRQVREREGVLLRGNGLRGQVLPARITSDVAGAVREADVVVVSTVAGRHEHVADLIAPAVRDDQVVAIVPGNMGSLLFAERFAAAGVKARPVLAEVQGNLFPNRITGPAEVNAGAGLRRKRVAAFPAQRTAEAVERLAGVIDAETARNVVETTLNTPNVVNHVAASVLNATQIEQRGSSFALFRDGITPSVIRAIDAAYAEVSSVLDALGYFKQQNPADFVRKVAEYDEHPELDVFRSFAGPTSLTHRYISEDAPAGVALLVSVARAIGVEVPLTRSLLTVTSVINGVDYLQQGRTLERFGLAGATPEQIEAFFRTGRHEGEQTDDE